MYLKENIIRLIIILMIIVFAAGAFFTVTFFKKELNLATNPSKEIVKGNSGSFDSETYQEVLKKLQ